MDVDAAARNFVYRMHEEREDYTLVAAPARKSWHGRVLHWLTR
jgi:hypothetical protein